MEWLPIQTSPKKDPNAVRAYGLNFLPGTWKEKDKINPKKKKTCWGLDRNFILCEETSQHSLNQTSKMMIRQTGANSNLVGHKQSRAVW